MQRLIVIVAALGTMLAVPSATQAQRWDEQTLVAGAVELRLRNDEGAAIILGCHSEGIAVGFELPEPLGSAAQASVRGIPGGQQNIAVTQVSDHLVRVTSGSGLEVMLRMLRNSARLYLRVGGRTASFNIAGSAHIVGRCIEAQDEPIRDPTRRF